jgi:DNA-binding beta-propeller fold protein YncE
MGEGRRGKLVHRIVSAAALIVCATVADVQNVSGGVLHLTQTTPLLGVEGRIDHLAVDLVGRRIFLCALGNNTVEVIDLQKGARLSSITGLGAPQGVAYVPQPSRVFVATDKGGLCNFYDGKSLALLGSADFKDDADNMRYDEVAQRIYVGFGNGGLGILDARSGKDIGSVQLSGHPEAFVLEKNGPRIFVNVPTARHVAVVDRNKREVTATWTTGWAFANYPIAFDEANHRLFVGCRLPAKIVVLNTDSGAAVTSFGIGGDADDIFYDAARHCLYAICGGGTINVIEQIDRDSYEVSAKFPTASGARTGLFVPELNSLFVAIPHHGNQNAEVRRYSID